MRYSLVLIWAVILVHGQLLIPGSLADICQPPFMRRGNECFSIHEATLTWDESKQRCLQMGGDLAQPQDIVDFVRYVEENSPNLKFQDSIIWLGATDRQTEDQWKWISGESVLSTMWALKPSIVGSTEPNGDGDCLNLYYYGIFFINDANCERKGHFVCEKTACSESEGFVRVPGSGNSCFKVLNSPKSWNDAKSSCESEGLQLAKTDDPIAVRKFVTDNYGLRVWLGGRGSASGVVKWIRDDTVLSSEDSAWHPHMLSSRTTTGYCLMFLSIPYYTNSAPTGPYYMDPCTHTYNPLCELV